jgi:predicted ester cyclase
MFRSGMPDLRVNIEDMVAEGDRVATRYALEGTHGGDLFGIAPTGRHLSIKSMTVERLSGQDRRALARHRRAGHDAPTRRHRGTGNQPDEHGGVT